jgi:hypothetical protein
MTATTRATCAAVTLIIVAAVAGCGSSSTPPGTTATTTSTPSATAGQPGGQAGAQRGFDPAVFQQAQACLKAAGITVPSRPKSGAPGGGFTPGANRPTDGSGTVGGPRRTAGANGGGGIFNNPKALAALKACGITLPTSRGRGTSSQP